MNLQRFDLEFLLSDISQMSLHEKLPQTTVSIIALYKICQFLVALSRYFFYCIMTWLFLETFILE